MNEISHKTFLCVFALAVLEARLVQPRLFKLEFGSQASD